MAKLALHDAYSRFRADMFLSSLAESSSSTFVFYLPKLRYAAIALPMGMTSAKAMSPTPGSQEISVILNNAEQLFWSDLALIARRGQVPQVREAAISLALIRAFQTSLGKSGLEGPVLAARLLG
jgi:separase